MTGQSGTEIYVFNLNKKDQDFSISKPVNVSEKHPGYDNQPHFLTDGSMYYVSERNGQTDVMRVGRDNSRTSLTATEVGGEYSPTPIPGSDDFSAVRLDTTGLQLLYRYSMEKDEPEVILEDVVVGYHQWINKNELLAFVLGETTTLQHCNVNTQHCRAIDSNIGRSIHKIPGSKEGLMSYISKEGDNWEIRSYNPSTGETNKIIETLPASEDLAWSPDGTIFMGSGDKLFKYKPGSDQKWIEIADLSDFGLNGITRLAVNLKGDKIAVVVNE